MSRNQGSARPPASLKCWACKTPYTLEQRTASDGNCPHCGEEIELHDVVIDMQSAPVSAPMGEELPPLDDDTIMAEYERIVAYPERLTSGDYATAIKLAQWAVAPYAERIRQLERELAERASSPEIPDGSQSIGDEPEFERLLAEYVKALDSNLETYATAKRALIAYIDGRTTGAVPDVGEEK